jgi:hypothetical protein
MRVVLLIGTKKGVFLAEGDAGRRAWRLRGPLISGTWSICHLAYHPGRGRIYAGGSSNWYGPAVWWSDDLGETWVHSSEGIVFGDGGPAVQQIWSVAPADGLLYAGVDPAGLFRSADGGETWEHLGALRAHPTRETWRETNAGLPLHAVLTAPGDARRLWVAVGAGGTYRSEDGGESWMRLGEAGGPCVHGLALAPGAAGRNGERGHRRLYQQSHDGVFRSDDAGGTWVDVSAGLPSRFGFPVATHPRGPDTAYVVPLDAGGERRSPPGGRLAVWRSRDAGGTWERLDRGLPEGPVHVTVWRGALGTDDLDPAGVYLGTSTGQLYASPDEGETWAPVAPYLPPILCLKAVVPDA